MARTTEARRARRAATTRLDLQVPAERLADDPGIAMTGFGQHLFVWIGGGQIGDVRTRSLGYLAGGGARQLARELALRLSRDDQRALLEELEAELGEAR